MVVVFESKTGTYDFIVQTSVAFAMAKLNCSRSVPDDRIEQFVSTLDLSDETGVGLVGHGSPGAIEKWSASQIGDTLADPVRGVSKKLRQSFGIQESGKMAAARGGNNLVARTVSSTANLGTLGPESATVSKDFCTKFINDLDDAKPKKLTLEGDDVARVCTVID
jgi:hypothetical protein